MLWFREHDYCFQDVLLWFLTVFTDFFSQAIIFCSLLICFSQALKEFCFLSLYSQAMMIFFVFYTFIFFSQAMIFFFLVSYSFIFFSQALMICFLFVTLLYIFFSSYDDFFFVSYSLIFSSQVMVEFSVFAMGF